MAKRGLVLRAIAHTDMGLSNVLDEVGDLILSSHNCTGDVGDSTFDFDVVDVEDSYSVFDVARYCLSYNDGKAVQEILNRYVREELYKQRDALTTIGEDSWQLEKDIDYITGLAKLFD